MAKKRKTSKAAQKRFKVTASNKLLKRPTRQDHFNAKDSGNDTRRKRSQGQIKGSVAISNIKKIISIR